MANIGPTEFGDYVFPIWADLLGWLIGACTLLPFILFSFYEIFACWLNGKVNQSWQQTFFIAICLSIHFAFYFFSRICLFFFAAPFCFMFLILCIHIHFVPFCLLENKSQLAFLRALFCSLNILYKFTKGIPIFFGANYKNLKS